jgi:hypothetical protein
VTFRGDRKVTFVSTTAKSERTASGVGVGSTQSQVRAGVPGVVCARAYDPVRIECQVGKHVAGQPITSFFLRNGNVYEASVWAYFDGGR